MKQQRLSRRAMFCGMGASLAASAIAAGPAAAQSSAGAFAPARHPQDSWLNGVPGRHRTFIDCASTAAAGSGLLYANNLYLANRSGYQLNESDVAIVVCLRHFATAFAFNDAIWGKYGSAIGAAVQFTDPRTRQAPTANLLNATDYGALLPNGGVSIASVATRGTQFAVCDMATQFITGQVASAINGNAQAVYKEFVANLIPNSHVVAAGVVAVNRAQEYGYTLLTAL